MVFKATIDGIDQALRFFIREDAAITGERYAALARHLDDSGLVDAVASFQWVDDAIEVNGRTWPMLQMEWVDGPPLDSYVSELADRREGAALGRLAERWRELVGRLQEARFAHGDLQHGNVLVDPADALRLIDFDGSWVPALAGQAPPHETGHPDYQRPDRHWGPWMDTFPGLVIYTGLLALSRRPDAWQSLGGGENILFSRHDLQPPFDTRAWQLLAEIDDEQVARVVDRLRVCCDPRWVAELSLEEVLHGSGRPGRRLSSVRQL